MMSLALPPTAVFIADPLTACGAINEARKLGLRIPEELSILGFDDSDSRFSVEPTMTAICQNSSDLGRLAFEMLLERCEGERTSFADEPGRAWLEINHTTARVPASPVRIMPNGERLPVSR
jgi:DNA-binding LacI/PurR family transcriptional regulator